MVIVVALEAALLSVALALYLSSESSGPRIPSSVAVTTPAPSPAAVPVSFPADLVGSTQASLPGRGGEAGSGSEAGVVAIRRTTPQP